MNPSSPNDGVMYKAAAFSIFIVLVTLIVIAQIASRDSYASEPNYGTESSTQGSDIIPDSNPGTADSVDESQETTQKLESTAAPETTTSASETEPIDSPIKSDPSSAVDAPSKYTPEDIAEFLALYPNTVLAETEDAGQEYIDKLIFLGDSTTYGLRANKVLKDGKDTKQVWTPTNGYITLSSVNTVLIWYPDTDEELTIKDAVAKKQPEYLVITLGVNGVSFMGEEYFKKEYGKLIESIQEASPETKLILQSIFPVAENYESLKSINNEKIDAANRWICQLADDYGIKYLDTNSVLRGSDGWLVSSYQNGDGLHLTAEGLNLELNNLRTHAWID